MLERHHIVFKSQGGLDFDLNYKHLTSEQHRGDKGPHKCKDTDNRYKLQMQTSLFAILTRDYYSITELVDLLWLDVKQANKAFKKIETYKGVKKEDAVKRLMGGRFY